MTFNLTDHACSSCFGRILERAKGEGPRFRCAECGATSNAAMQALCCCGVSVGGKPGLECIKNPVRSPAAPQEVVVRQRPPRRREARVQDKDSAMGRVREMFDLTTEGE